MKKPFVIMGKILLTLLCILIPSAIATLCKQAGITLGFLPTALIYFPVIAALFWMWRKQPSPKCGCTSYADVAKIGEAQPVVAEQGDAKRPLLRRKTSGVYAMKVVHICCTAALLILTVCLGFFAMRLKNENDSIRLEIAARDVEIADMVAVHNQEIEDAVAARDEEWNAYIDYIKPVENEEHPDEYSAIDDVNAFVDSVRQGNMAISTWSFYKQIYGTIKNMFRDVSADVISEYFDEVYYLRTNMYPLDYFREKGYVYTGDVIEGWIP